MPPPPIRDARTIEGGADAANMIRRRLERLLKSPELHKGIKLKLFRQTRSEEKLIDTFTFDLGGDLDEKIAEIVNSAEEDAGSHPPGETSYALRLDADDYEKKSSFTLRMPSIDDDEGIIHNRYVPNDAGLQEALMDYNVRMSEKLLKSGDRNAARDERTIVRLEQKLEWYERRHFDLVQKMEEVASMASLRQREERKAAKEEERQEFLFDGAKQAVPALLAYLGTGKLPGMPGMPGMPGGPGGEQPATGSQPDEGPDPRPYMDRLIGSLDTEQEVALVESLRKLLRLDQLQDFVQVHRMTIERLNRQAAAADQRVRGSAGQQNNGYANGHADPRTTGHADPRTGGMG